MIYRLRYFFLCMIVLLGGCTKDVAIGPEISESRDWAPQISLVEVGHQRFHISISAPQSNLVSAVRSYIIRVTGVNGTNLEFIDEVDRISGLIFRYISEDAILTEGGEYEITVSVRYIDDVRNVSNTLAIQAPETPGEILERVAVPASWFEINLQGIASWNGAFYRLFGQQLLKLDTTTAEVSFISIPFIRNSGATRLVGSKAGKVVLSQRRDSAVIKHILVETDVISGFTRNLFSIESNVDEWSFEPKALNGSRVLMLAKKFGPEGTLLQYRLYNSETGMLESTFPFVSNEALESFAYYEMVGDTIWRAGPASFDSRLQKIDPQTGQILAEYRIPVFDFTELHYDDGFWVVENFGFDAYSANAVKIEPGEL